MTELSAAAVQAALAKFPDPETGGSALELGQFRDVRVESGTISLTLALTSWSAPIADDVVQSLEMLLQAQFPAASQIAIQRTVLDRPPQPIGEIQLTAKSVIAVGSGKGGVGKSTIAATVALTLKRAGAAVGLMDADVYGPSIPHLLGVSGRPEVVDRKLRAVDFGGMPVMSMGFLVPPGEAVVWRGPMLHGAITQFLRDTAWGPLDYLVIDMPPGTGDIALTLSQLLPLTGAVVVCTPQDVALLDAVKAIAMFRKVNINVLGMVENMSGFVCPDCGKRYDIFGSGGARRRAEELGVPFLGEVPIQMQIRVAGDAGQTVNTCTDPATAPYFERICRRLVTNIAQSKTRPTSPLPSL
jgi:ATP-binding protein involved in chromosome partitioning